MLHDYGDKTILVHRENPELLGTVPNMDENFRSLMVSFSKHTKYIKRVLV